MSQMFFRLTHHDWVECFTKLSRAELGVLFYLRTLNPFGDRHLKINCQAIGEVLDIHRTSVSRALKKLEKENLIELEITSAQVKLIKSDNSDTEQDSENDASPFIDSDSTSSVHPRTDRAPTHGDRAPTHGDRAPTHGDRAPTHGSVHPRTICVPETPPDKAFKTPQTLQTYKDFKDSLSEGEREKFFNFVKEKTNNLEKPINDLEAWLASKNAAKQNRWEIYYRNYQEQQINEGRKTTRHSENGGSSPLGEKNSAIAKFREKMRIDELVDEPENVDSEEFQRQQAEFNKLLDNPPEPGESGERKSLAQQRREQIAEAKRQQEERKRANKEAADKRAEKQNLDVDGYKDRILRQLEEFNRLRNIGNNPEIEEKLENDEEDLEKEVRGSALEDTASHNGEVPPLDLHAAEAFVEQEAEDEKVESPNFDIDEYEDEIQRQIEEFNRLHNIGNYAEIEEIDEEDLEDE